MSNNPMDPRLATSQSSDNEDMDMDIDNPSEGKDVDLRTFGDLANEQDEQRAKEDMGDVDLRSDVDMRGDKQQELTEETAEKGTVFTAITSLDHNS